MDVLAQLNTVLAGRYAIARQIGAGGMATVYLARDIRHSRDVALKVLNPELGAILGIERFLAEIQVAAHLQHPNVLPLFDSGEAGGLLFFVMPYVSGESLRGRLAREKLLPVTEAVHIATVIAGALEHAHRHGVIHRDLKPENILLLGGEPVLADFGIALAVLKAGGTRITETGISLGTPQYMSPEQATGERAIDARSDVYSLGVLTYEMLTGELPHTGANAQAIVARLLTVRPRRVSESRSSVPATVDAAVERALEKIPADRWSTAADFAHALQISPETQLGRTRSRGDRSTVQRMSSAVAAVLVALGASIGGLAGWWWSSRDGSAIDPSTTVRFDIEVDEGSSHLSRVAIAPDGKAVVFVGGGPKGVQLYRRLMDQTARVPLVGTDGAGSHSISPSGEWVAFIADGHLRKVPSDGGPVLSLTNAPNPTGIAWVSDEALILGEQPPHRGLTRVSASNGTAQALTAPDTTKGESGHRWPRVLADGQTVLYTSWGLKRTENARIGMISLATGENTILNVSGQYALGVVAGHLIYVHAEGAIMAAPIDLRRRKIRAEPFLLDRGTGFLLRPGSIDLSAGGSLAYVARSTTNRLLLVDGRTAPRVLMTSRGDFHGPTFSPDGQKIAVSIGLYPRIDVWVYDLVTGGQVCVTAGDTGWNLHPTWSPDGTRIAFSSGRRGKDALWWQAADGSAPAEMLGSTDTDLNEPTFSRDGAAMAFRKVNAGQHDIAYRSPIGDSVSRLLLDTPSREMHPRLSPDGQWLAYVSNETGNDQVYLRAVRGHPTRTPISTGGGAEPRWTADGRHVFYRTPSRELMAATISTNPRLAITSRRRVLVDSYILGANHHQFDVSPDGKRFVFSQYEESTTSITVVANWLAGIAGRLTSR